MYHRFFYLARSSYLSLFSFSLSVTLWSTGTAKFRLQQVLFFGDYHWIVWVRLNDPFRSQNPKEFYYSQMMLESFAVMLLSHFWLLKFHQHSICVVGNHIWASSTHQPWMHQISLNIWHLQRKRFYMSYKMWYADIYEMRIKILRRKHFFF